MKSGDARHFSAIAVSGDGFKKGEGVMLEDIMVHEILRRFSSKNRALLCDKCRQYTNAVAQAEVPETMLFSLLLLIRRDSGRDFTTFWQGKEVILSCVEVMGYMVPRLRVGSASYVSSAIIMRHGCKAHSCWDRRSRLLQARLRSLPVGAGDADMLAYAKYYLSCGFGLDQEKEAVLDMHCVSEKRKKMHRMLQDALKIWAGTFVMLKTRPVRNSTLEFSP